MKQVNERIMQGLDPRMMTLLERFIHDYQDFYRQAPLKELDRPVEKPWGAFLTFVMNDPANVKLMSILPQQALSYQYHTKRGELWFVLQERVQAILGDPETLKRDPAIAALLREVEDEEKLLNDEELAILARKLRSFELAGGEFIYVPREFIHTLINPGEEIARVLEVAIGEFAEEDVVRVYDKFHRKSGTI